MTTTPPSGYDGPYDAPIRISDLKVLPDWIDYNGHMNASYYGLTFQKEAERALEEILGFGATFARLGETGSFLLQSHISYVGELMEGEPFYITMRLLDHDSKRSHIFFEMISDRSGKLCATAEYVNMNVHKERRRGADFPDWLKKRFEDMQASHSDLERPAQVGAPIGLRRA